MRKLLRWVVGILIGLLILACTMSTVSCTKTVTGPTVYLTDTITSPIVHDTVTVIDTVTITVVDTVEGLYGDQTIAMAFKFFISHDLPYCTITNQGELWNSDTLVMTEISYYNNICSLNGVSVSANTINSRISFSRDPVRMQWHVWYASEYDPWPNGLTLWEIETGDTNSAITRVVTEAFQTYNSVN